MAHIGTAPPASPAYAPVVPSGGQVMAPQWVGGYVGISGGGSVTERTVGLAGAPSGKTGRAIVGGFAGYMLPLGAFAAGVEGDLDARIPGSSGSVLYAPSVGSIRLPSDGPFRSSLRARFGTDIAGSLLYVTGGGVLGQWGSTDGNQAWRSGWTVGLGLEMPLSKHWRGRVEYRYSDFGAVDRPLSTFSSMQLRERLSDDAVVFGLGYQFSPR